MSTIAQLTALVNSTILTGGSRTVAVNHRALLIDIINSLAVTPAVDAYDADRVYYLGEYVLYNGVLYKYINAASASGQVPTNVTYWETATTGDLIRAPFIKMDYVDLAALRAAGGLTVGQYYYIADRDVIIEAIDVNAFSYSGVYISRNPDYQNVNGDFIGIWKSTLAPTAGKLVAWDSLHWQNITGTNGDSNPPADAVRWFIQGYGTHLGAWNSGLTPSVTQTVSRNGVYYYNLTGVNTATEPASDTTNWRRVQRLSADYVPEVCFCLYHFSTGWMDEIRDTRGNIYRYNNVDGYSLGPWAHYKFRFGHTNVYNNVLLSSRAYIDNANNYCRYWNNVVYDGAQVKNIVDVFGGIFTNNHVYGGIEDVTYGATTSGITNLRLHGYFESATLSSGAKVSGVVIGRNTFITGTLAASVEILNGMIDIPAYFYLDVFTVTQRNKIAVMGNSTFEAPLDLDDGAIFSGTTITIPTNMRDFIGIYNVLAPYGSTAESISKIIGSPTSDFDVNFELRPESGLALTLTGTAVASAVADEIILPTATLVIDGTNKDWVKLTTSYRSGISRVYQIDAQNYI